MRPIPKDVATTGIEPGRTLNAGAIMTNLMFHLAENYDDQYDILPSIDVTFPEQDFTCDLGIFPPRKIDWLNDLIRVEPPISAFEIIMPTETAESLAAAIRRYYFPNGVKSAWVIFSTQKLIWLLHPDQPPQPFTEGTIHDTASGLTVEVSEVYR